jgi:hypothetical protein
VSDVTVKSFTRLIGASGTVNINAPLPIFDAIESPYELVATT